MTYSIVVHKFSTMPQLTNLQRDELIEQYVDLMVDSMEIKDLVSYVTQDMTEFLEKLTDRELEDEIVYTNEQELYDELVDNVTSKPDAALLTMNTDNLPNINDNEAEGITE